MKKASLHITADEYQLRTEKLLELLQGENLSGAVLFDRDYILYYTGFAFIPTERPIAFIVNAKGERAMFVPRLEVEHASANALIDRVDYYLEYPHQPRPMDIFKDVVSEMGISGAFGADHNGYPLIFGYRGRSLTELLGVTPKPLGKFIEDQMMF